MQSSIRFILDMREASAFIVHFGFDPESFDCLLGLFEEHYPVDANTGRPRNFTADMALALVLMYLHNTIKQETLCVLFGATAATISRTKNLGLDILETIFRSSPNDHRWRIVWPKVQEMKVFNDMILSNTMFENETRVLNGVFGFVDGLNVPIETPKDDLEQNAYYNGWLSGHYSSQVLVFTSDGCICWVR
ncbi:hypothetical protein [Parasitella parasitica]|uniref:DDE Tnp4 domain-containing protein n=1 Tax=Parasitella parasitica TaxID=35722 RepID=A0A0B7MUE1_9FUNG|nr:hypothetical protein [Parasitella parasitica]